MIHIQNVEVVKSGQKLFEKLDWTIQSNEHWVIGGLNGSGKTVLLELLAGVIHPSHGEINYSFIKGTSWDERFAQRKKHLHYIPTNAIQNLLQHHELFYQQRYYSMGDERVPLVRDLLGEATHLLKFPSSFSIESLLNLKLTRLSNGQLKKVVILKNLMEEIPRVLLFDYPFEGLDPNSRNDLIDFLDYLVKEFNVQLILVDHSHHLPGAINRRLILENFKIKTIDDSFSTRSTSATPAKSPEHSTNDPVVEMRNVTIRYGEKEIIRNFNWKISKGERWALTGANGSGKTTIFSLIYADHPMAYAQHIYLFGKRRGTGESIWDIKKRINYLGPELLTYLNPAGIVSSGYDYIIEHHKKINTNQLDNVVQYFQADRFIRKPVRSLSSGQLQLMLIISSLLSDKELLLLDEPFQFLDPHQKYLLTNYLNGHLHSDTTLILITHYEEDIHHWTNHRMVLP